MNGVFLDAGEYVVVLWRLKDWRQVAAERLIRQWSASIRHGKVIESQMFYSDTAAIVQFLAKS